MDLYPQCWNEHDELKTVIVCAPSILDIPDQKTAQDVRWDKPADHEKAQADFEAMVFTMEKEGIRVIDYSDYLPPTERKFHEQLINRFFVRDLACAFGNTVILGEAGTSIRRPEYRLLAQLFEQWFSPETFSVEWSHAFNALENGDVLILNKNAIFINIGLRTSYESVQALTQYLFHIGFSEIGVIDLPRKGNTLHLDMCCNVSGPDIMIAKSYMRYFPVEILKKDESSYMMMHEFLERHSYEIIWTDEVKNAVTDINFINIDPETLVISTKANKKIFKHPKLKNKRLIEVEVAELEKGGGGIRCMTLPIERV